MIPRKEEIPTPSFPLFLHGFGIMLFSGDDGWGNGGVSGVYFFRLSPSSFLSLLQQPLEIIFHFLCHHSPPFRLSVVAGSMVTLFDCFQILFCGRHTEEERCKMFYCHLDRKCIYQISFGKGTKKIRATHPTIPHKKRKEGSEITASNRCQHSSFLERDFLGVIVALVWVEEIQTFLSDFEDCFERQHFSGEIFFFGCRGRKKKKILTEQHESFILNYSPPQKNNISARKHGQLWLLFSKTNAHVQSCLFWVYPGKK